MKIKNLLKACELLDINLNNIPINNFTNEDFEIIIDCLFDNTNIANTLSFNEIICYDGFNINHLIKIKKHYKHGDIKPFFKAVLNSKNDNLKQELVNLILKEEIFK